eukprot:4311516-Pleurochrysis_carterae.AAC.1
MASEARSMALASKARSKALASKAQGSSTIDRLVRHWRAKRLVQQMGIPAKEACPGSGSRLQLSS